LIGDAFAALETLPAIVALRQSTLAFPIVNALHVVGVALLFGSIVPLDLCLAGWRHDAGQVDALARLLLPVAMVGFGLAAAAGLLLFATNASVYAASALFQAKIVLIVLALLNALALRRTAWQSGSRRWAAVAGGASILLWLGALVLGRVVGYFTS
jgi:hypothetical protein